MRRLILDDTLMTRVNVDMNKKRLASYYICADEDGRLYVRNVYDERWTVVTIKRLKGVE